MGSEAKAAGSGRELGSRPQTPVGGGHFRADGQTLTLKGSATNAAAAAILGLVGFQQEAERQGGVLKKTAGEGGRGGGTGGWAPAKAKQR